MTVNLKTFWNNVYNNKDLTKFHQYGAYPFVKLLINKFRGRKLTNVNDIANANMLTMLTRCLEL